MGHPAKSQTAAVTSRLQDVFYESAVVVVLVLDIDTNVATLTKKAASLQDSCNIPRLKHLHILALNIHVISQRCCCDVHKRQKHQKCAVTVARCGIPNTSDYLCLFQDRLKSVYLKNIGRIS